MDLQIREAVEADAEAVVGILNPIIESGAYSALDTILTPAAERDFIAQFPERGIFLVEYPFVRSGFDPPRSR